MERKSNPICFCQKKAINSGNQQKTLRVVNHLQSINWGSTAGSLNTAQLESDVEIGQPWGMSRAYPALGMH